MLTQSADDWPLLSEARARLDLLIANPAATTIADDPDEPDEPVETRLVIAAFQEIIRCGEIPIKAIRSDCGRITPEPVDALLRAASHASLYYTDDVDSSVNEIDAYFDSCCDRSIFGPRSNLRDIQVYWPVTGRDLQIRLFDVRVYWPALNQALAMIGFFFPKREPEAAPEIIHEFPAQAERAPSVAVSLSAKPASKLPPIPEAKLKEFFHQIKQKNSSAPSQAEAMEWAKTRFPQNHIPRKMFRKMYWEVWGRQPPGPRRKNSAGI